MADREKLIEARRWFSAQPRELREEIVKVLEDSEPSISVEALVKKLVASLTSAKIDRRPCVELITWLASVVPVFADEEAMRTRLADTLARVDANKPDEEALSLADHYRRLLACEHSIGLTGKAQSIMWGHGRVFHDARVITQIRPIFYNDLEASTANALIVHELHLDYREGGRDESICITADADKLRQLSDVLERATYKERNLRRDLQFNYLGEGGDA